MTIWRLSIPQHNWSVPKIVFLYCIVLYSSWLDVIVVNCGSESQLILIETLQQENAKFAECQAIEEVTHTVSKLQVLYASLRIR